MTFVHQEPDLKNRELPLRHSLRVKLPLLLGAFAAIMLATFLWATHREVEQTLVEAGTARAEGAAYQFADLISGLTQASLAQMDQLRRNPQIVAAVRDGRPADLAAASQLLAGARPNALRRDEIWDRNGNLVLESVQNAPDTVRDIKAYPRRPAPTQAGISDLRALGRYTYFEIVAEISDTAAGLPPLGWLRRHGRLAMTPGVVQRLLGAQGELKVGTPGQGVWTDLSTLVAAPPAAANGGDTGDFQNGGQWLGAALPIAGAPWVVWVGFPRDEVMNPLNPFLRRMTAIALLFVAASFVIAALLGHHLTKPVRALADAAQRIATGDYAHRVGLRRKDELGRLAESFDTMSAHVQSAYNELQRSNTQIHFSLAAARIGVWESHPETGEIRCSESLAMILGIAPGELPRTLEQFLAAVHPEDRVAAERLLRASESNKTMVAEYRAMRPDGAVAWVECKARRMRTTGEAETVLGVSIDITGRRKLETQFRQSQKMEAIGQLSGGVAHDFNNLLTAIVGHGNLMLSELPEDHPLRDDVIEILKAGESAAGLTRQLLSFSRQSITQYDVIDLNEVVSNTNKLLQRLLSEKITLKTELDADLCPVRADPSLMQQVLVNLAVNARDAIPDRGELRISTANTVLTEEFATTHPDLESGEYVMLTVTDTGSGMDATTQAHLFEPFFTTKAVGKGTGLGLATVFGIVKQSGGHIYVYSELGMGTRFVIYLPAAHGAVVSPRKTVVPDVAGGNETILLVEDDELVRSIATTILKRLGYQLIVATNAEHALRVIENNTSEPDLLLSDVIMPGLNGPDLFHKLQPRFPRMKALFTSGYPGSALTALGLEKAAATFIEKPYSPAGLAAKVREALNR